MKHAIYQVVDKQTKKVVNEFGEKAAAKALRNTLQAETKQGLPVVEFDKDGGIISDGRPIESNWRYAVRTVYNQ